MKILFRQGLIKYKVHKKTFTKKIPTKDRDSIYYPKVHKCMHCQKYYVLEKNKEIYFNLKRRPNNTKVVTCSKCIDGEYDTVLDEYKLTNRVSTYLCGDKFHASHFSIHSKFKYGINRELEQIKLNKKSLKTLKK